MQYLHAVERSVKDQRWSILSEVWLSTFSFESLVLYKDLDAMAEIATGHSVVAALARATVVDAGTDEVGTSLDDLPSPETVPIPVLPADGSQLEAMTLGTTGAHLVIHGPPGTGKSQTISNLIADALGRNKKVLFVSSKMAALNVVHQRLQERGLARFCLEAHSTKAGKAKIIDELRRTLEAEDLSDGGRFEETLSSITRVRSDLNRYVQELHRVREPLGKTLYQAIGRVTKLSTAPELRAPLPWTELSSVSREDFACRYDLLSEVSAQTNIFDQRAAHPWRGFSAPATTIFDRERIEQDLRTILETCNRVRALIPHLQAVMPANDISIGNLAQLQPALASIATLDRLPHDWFATNVEQLEQKAALFDTAARMQRDFESQLEIYNQHFGLPPEQTGALLLPAVLQFSKRYQRIMPSYWKWRATAQRSAKHGTKITHSLAIRVHSITSRLADMDNWFVNQRPELSVESPKNRDAEGFSYAAKRYRAAAALVAVLRAVEEQPAQQTEIPDAFRQAVQEIPRILSDVLHHSMDRLDRHWPKDFVEGCSTRTALTGALASRASEVLGALSLMQEWVALQRTLQKWQREELIVKFSTLDSSVRELAALHIQGKAADSARRLRSAQSSLTGSEVGILRRELQKRKKIKPLRKLFGEIPHALQALKPCMLMSPISVSTYLKPGSVTFDLVVFDEASQLPTQEGIAGILRAEQVVVAGDRNQLPPTSFFRAQLDLDESEENDENGQNADEPLESLLDEAVASVPMFREAHLKWHYRSKDERLIKFSNAFFYDNRLVTFPSASTDSDGQGVRLVYVPDGVWDRGRSRTNRIEARKVADLVIEHFSRFPHRSLGVVAMNIQQKEAIEDALAEALERRPDVRPLMDPVSIHEPFFVKSLENVQGDERDAIMISVGYCKDGNGHPSSNFGPLSRDGGWRRLNVLITRAKWHLTLVTGIRSQELSGVSPNNRGAVALRDFIAYAERNCELPQSASIPTGGETNDFEDAVAIALRDRGLSVDEQVGASKFRIDLAVRDWRDPCRYILGVECDGATYHSTRTARDRDILRQRVLESMGWRIHRVWSTEWFHDRDRAFERILASLKLAECRPVAESVQGAPPHEGTGRRNSVSVPRVSTARDDRAETKRRYQPGIPYRKFIATADRDLLIQSRFSSGLEALVARIVEAEGPVHEDLLAERLKEVCGVERAGSNVHSNVTEAILTAMSRKQIERRSQRNFLWRKDAPLNTFRVPSNSFRRPIEWIHREEISLAILYLVEDQFGISRADLGRAVARIFGLERASAETCDSILEVADQLVERGSLKNDGAIFSLPESIDK